LVYMHMFAHKSSVSAQKGPKPVALRTRNPTFVNNKKVDQKPSLLLGGRKRVSGLGSSLSFWGKLLTQQNLGHVHETVGVVPLSFSLPFLNSVSQIWFRLHRGVILTSPCDNESHQRVANFLLGPPNAFAALLGMQGKGCGGRGRAVGSCDCGV
jgi:hypothetical protein